MIVKNIKCKFFRNISDLNVLLDNHINVIIGNNGQGKTNFLESLYYLSTTRSFRVNSDKDLVMDNCEYSIVECHLLKDDLKLDLRCIIHDQGKSCFISKKSISKTSEFIGNLNAVLFVPSDIELFCSSPKNRRKLMNIEIGKCDNLYSSYLNKYNFLMKERNTFLKNNKDDELFLDAIESQMVDFEIRIIKFRNEFVDFINSKISDYYYDISNENHQIICKYKCINDKFDGSSTSLINLLKENRDRDRILKSTSIGIHKDDLEFYMDSKNLDSYASQGQKRMVILAMKLAFIEYVRFKKNDLPILLLDDVLSELDFQRKRNLFNSIPSEVQTIITSTDIDQDMINMVENIKIFKMNHGIIESLEG